jgi:MT0933-like antitoxin protein
VNPPSPRLAIVVDVDGAEEDGVGKISDARWLASKAKELVAKNDAKVKEALDKAAGAVDSRTKGKYSEKIEGALSKAKGAVDKLPDRASAADEQAPPDAPAPEPPPPGPPPPGDAGH